VIHEYTRSRARARLRPLTFPEPPFALSHRHTQIIIHPFDNRKAVRCAAASRAAVNAADYSPKKAFFFPGQGAQSVGMAKAGGGGAVYKLNALGPIHP
jgi:hypothetical protein